MDNLTKEFQTFLVNMAYHGIATHELEHKMEHLLALLEPDDEETVVHYFGLFGEARLSLDEIANNRGETPEQAIAAIDRSLRKLAVTPEWQMIKNEKR